MLPLWWMNEKSILISNGKLVWHGHGNCRTHACCLVQNHSPLCKCDSGFIGDPFSACYPPPTTPPPPEPTVSDPCDPNPCGLNALARPSDDRCICSCPPGQQGDPYVQCKPEQCEPTAVCRVNNHRADCVVDEECPQVLAC